MWESVGWTIQRYPVTIGFVDKTTQYYSFVQNVYTWIDSTIYCFLPFFTITTLNTLIIRTLFKEARRKQKLAHVISGHGISAQEKQITKVLLVLTTMFLFTTGPPCLGATYSQNISNYCKVI